MTTVERIDTQEDTSSWTRELSLSLQSVKTTEDLFAFGRRIENLRPLKDAWECAIPPYRKKAAEFGYVPDQKIVAVGIGGNSFEDIKDINQSVGWDRFLVCLDAECTVGQQSVGEEYEAASCRLVMQEDGFSESDMLASIAYQAQLFGQSCVLFTDDPMCWQCLGPKTVICHNGSFYNSEWLLAAHKIYPSQVPAFGALTALGVSQEKASNMLEAFGDPYGIIANNLHGLQEEVGDGEVHLLGRICERISNIHTLKRNARVIW